ncbi:hypothetical protein [Arthrobacter sp. SLBN-122]|uniref:hypothetical protein n=1 Tax=Arthrobacter sp. SLBN-122 TaxID=2768455 RepID=UPI001151031D|nr:hypothetical protein [Arthrobacter sp. SLBN-122]TQJ35588.1 hypothetical protein FBY36_2861 [Arthrobacter sp. SLBN-122]
MSDTQFQAVIACVILLLVIASAIIFARWNHSRLMSRARAEIEPDEALSLRSEFLDAITAASANQRTVVNTLPFWRGTGYRGYQRTMVIEPLLTEHIVSTPPSSGNAFANLFDRAVNYAFCIPASSLILSDRDWLRMVHDGVSAKNLVIERMRITLKSDSHDRTNIINSGGGNVSANQAGGNGKQTVRNVSQEHRSLPMGEFVELIKALRLDAVSAPTREVRQQINELADSMEDEVQADQPDELRLEGLLARATRYVKNFGLAMTTTKEVIDAIGNFGK